MCAQGGIFGGFPPSAHTRMPTFTLDLVQPARSRLLQQKVGDDRGHVVNGIAGDHFETVRAQRRQAEQPGARWRIATVRPSSGMVSTIGIASRNSR
jgi:hypothetical protein